MSGQDAEEALAVFLGSRRKAKALLERTTLRHLAEASELELGSLMPKDDARRLAAALRLARLILSPPPADLLLCAEDAVSHVHPYLAGRESERFVVVALDVRHRVIATNVLSEGTPASVSVRPADVFAVAFRHRASGLVLAHNHPSGDARPSAEDRELTRRLVEIGRLVGVPVLDHLVVCGDTFASVADGEGAPVQSVPGTRLRR